MKKALIVVVGVITTVMWGVLSGYAEYWFCTTFGLEGYPGTPVFWGIVAGVAIAGIVGRMMFELGRMVISE